MRSYSSDTNCGVDALLVNGTPLALGMPSGNAQQQGHTFYPQIETHIRVERP